MNSTLTTRVVLGLICLLGLSLTTTTLASSVAHSNSSDAGYIIGDDDNDGKHLPVPVRGTKPKRKSLGRGIVVGEIPPLKTLPVRPAYLPIQSTLFNDPIRFTMNSSKDSVAVGEEFEITIRAELLPITPSMMFFFEEQKSFSLKVLVPEGFVQTGGNYFDYVGGTLRPENPIQTVTLKGYQGILQKKSCFSLLRGSLNSIQTGIFVKKADICLNSRPNTKAGENLARVATPTPGAAPTNGNLLVNPQNSVQTLDPPQTLNAPTFSPGSDVQVCAGSSVVVTAACDFGIVRWLNNANASSTRTFFASNIVTSATYSAVCITFYPSATSVSASVLVTVNDNVPTSKPTLAGYSGIDNNTYDLCPDHGRSLIAAGCPIGYDQGYYWSKDGAHLTAGDADIIVISQPGIYRVHCINQGCIGPGSDRQITITNLNSCESYPSISGPSSVCPGTPITLNASCPTGYAPYWVNGNQDSPSITISQPGSYTAFCNLDGTIPNSVWRSVTIDTELPSAPNNPDGDTQCSGSQFNLSVSGCEANGYRWYDAAGTNLNHNTATYQPTLTASTSYSVSCVNSCGESTGKTQVDATVIPYLPINASNNGDTKCGEEQATVTVDNIEGASYSWVNKATNQVVSTSREFSAGNGTYRVTVSKTDFCNTTSETEVAIKPRLVITASNNGSTKCPGENAALGVSENNEVAGVTYVWKNSSDQVVNDPGSVGNGDYTVTATKSGYCDASAQTTVNIPGLNSVTSTSKAGLPDCGSGDVDFHADGCGTQTYVWFDAASNGNQLGTGSKYTITGLTSTTTLYVACRNGDCTSGRVGVTATINPRPSAPTSTTPDSRCGAGEVTLKAEGCQDGHYRWFTQQKDGDAIANETANTYKPTLSQSATYYVACNNGCESDSRKSVEATIHAVPSAPTTSDLTYCTTDSPGVLTATPATGGILTWFNPAGTQVATAPTPSVAATGETTYWVKQTVGNCESTTATLVVTIISRPDVPTVKITGTTSTLTTIQHNQTASLTAEGCPNGVDWYANDTRVGTNTNPYVTPALTTGTGTTTYKYKARCRSANQCGDSEMSGELSVDVQTACPASINVSASSNAVCSGATVTLDVSGCTGGSISWSHDANATNASISVTPTTTSPSQTIRYTATCTRSGCTTRTAFQDIVVTGKPAAPSAYQNGSLTRATNLEICGSHILGLRADGCAGTVHWYGPNGNLLHTGNPYVTPSQPANTTFYARCVNSCNEESVNSNPITLTVRPFPTGIPHIRVGNDYAPFTTATHYTVCEDARMTYGMNPWPVPSGNIQEWIDPNGVRFTVRDNTPLAQANWIRTNTPVPSGVYTYSLTNQYGCSSATQINISVTSLPTTPTNVRLNNSTGTNFCQGTAITFTANCASGNYLWTYVSGPNGAGPTTNSSSQIVLGSNVPAGPYHYTVQCTSGANGGGCYSSPQSINFTIHDLPDAPAFVSINGAAWTDKRWGEVTLCKGDKLRFGRKYFDDPGYSGVWTYLNTGFSWDNQVVDREINPINSTHMGVYEYKTTSPQGCVNASRVSVLVRSAPPVPTLYAHTGDIAPTGAAPTTLTVCLNAGQGLMTNLHPTPVNWYNAQTNALVQANAPVLGINPVTQTQTFYARVPDTGNGCGMSGASEPLTISVVNATAPVLTIDRTTLCPSQTALITVTGCSSDQIRWNNTTWGGMSFTVTAAGTYHAHCYSNGCYSPISNAVVVTSVTGPTPTLAVSGPLNCTTATVTLTAGGGSEYTFINPDKQVIQTGSAATKAIAAPGEYTVIVGNANSCTARATVTVTADLTPPSAAITSTGQIACPSTAQLTGPAVPAQATYAYSYNWTGTGIPANTNTNRTINPTEAGRYDLTVTNTTNGCIASGFATVTGAANFPNATITATGSIGCSSTAQLTGPAVPTQATYQYSYKWAGLGIPANTNTNQTINPTVAGTYNLTVTNTSNNCTATSSHEVTGNTNKPTFTFTNSKALNCTQTTTTLNAEITGGTAPYRYQLNAETAITSDDPTKSWTNKGAGAYELIVTSGNGCSDTRTLTLTKDATDPTLTVAGTNVLCAGQHTVLTATSNGSLKWDDNTIDAARTINNPAVGTNNYSVTATGSNGCTAVVNPSVTVHAQPNTPSISSNSPNKQVVTGGTLNLYSSISPAISGATYSWIGPNWTSNEANPSINAVTPALHTGSYTVTVTNGTCSASATTSVQIGTPSTPPPSAIALSPTPTAPGKYCQGTTIQLSSGCTTGALSWTQLNNATTYNNSPLTHPATSGVGTFTYVADCIANGVRSATVSATFEIVANPTVSLQTNRSEINCTNPNALLTATGGNAYTLLSPLTNNTTGQFSVTEGGAYQVRVSNANGCVALTNEVTLTKNITPPTVQIAGNTILNCNNGQTTLTASGASSYTWTATPALQGGKSEQNPLSVNVAGTYSVTGTAPNGCTNTTSVNVVADPSAISPGLTPQSGVLTCSVTSFVLTASGGNSYTLLNTNTTNTTGQFTVSTPDTFTVRVGNANNCTAIATTTLTRFTTAPTMTTTGNSVLTPASPNSTIGVTANLQNGAISGYSWTGPGVPANTVTSSIPVSQTGIYTVTVQGNNGCTSTTTITVTGDLTPVTASITPSATAICPGQTVNLVASGGVAYRWSNGPTTASNPVSPASTTTLSVTVTGSNGATALATATITVNTTPTVGITPGGAISCQSAATLTASGAATYAWNNGTQGASLTLNSAGSYTVTGTNATGCTATAWATVTGNGNTPTVNIPAVNPLTCTNTAVTLQANATLPGGGSISRYAWTRQGSPTILGTGATLPVSASGTYIVSVTASNDCVVTAQQVVTGDPATPTVQASVSGPITCGVSSVSLTASPATFAQYRWTTAGNVVSTAASFTTATEGLYNLTATQGNGCTATANVNVTRSANKPVAVANADQTTICSGESTFLWSPLTTGYSYTWTASIGAVQYTGNGSGFNNVTLGGVYTLRVTDANGCTSDPTSVTITVLPKSPTPTVSSTMAGLAPSGVSVTLVADGCLGGTVTWNTGDTGNRLVKAATLTATTYTATCQVPNQCVSSASSPISVQTPNPTPPTVQRPSKTLICGPQSVTITSQGCTAANMRVVWSTGATGGTLVVTPTVTTTYTAACWMGEVRSAASNAEVITVQNAHALALSGPTTYTAGQPLALVATPTPAGSYTYAWAGIPNSTTTNTLTVAAPADPGSYTLTATASTSSCNALATAVITVTASHAITTLALTQTSICAGGTLTVPFTATGAFAGGYNFTVQLSDATGSFASATTLTGTANESPATVTLPVGIAPGTGYRVRVVSTSPAINGTPSPTTLTVSGSATVSLAQSGSISCQSAATLTASGANTYVWNAPAGATGTGSTSASLTVNTPGTYTVTGTSAGGCTATASLSVSASPDALTVGIASSQTSVCTSASAVTLTAQPSTTVGVGYKWSTPPGAGQAGATTPTLAVSTSGVYGLTITQGTTCSATTSTTVLLGQLPSVTVVVPSATTLGQPMSLTAQVQPQPQNASYRWTGPNNFTATETAPILSFTSATTALNGTYSVLVTLPGGCTVTGTGSLSIGIPATNTATECDIRIVAKDSQNKETTKIPRTVPNSLSLSVESLDETALIGYSYQWTRTVSTSAGTTTTAVGTTPALAVLAIGEYRVTVSGTNNHTCFAYLTLSKSLCNTVVQTYQCGTNPATPISSSDTTPLTNLAPGDTIRTGDFDVVVTEVTGGGSGGWQGRGYTEIPYLKNQRIAVELNGAVVNDCYELVSGTVVSAYDPAWGGVRDVNAANIGADNDDPQTTLAKVQDAILTFSGSNSDKQRIDEYITKLQTQIVNDPNLTDEQRVQGLEDLALAKKAWEDLKACATARIAMALARVATPSCSKETVSDAFAKVNNTLTTAIAPCNAPRPTGPGQEGQTAVTTGTRTVVEPGIGGGSFEQQCQKTWFYFSGAPASLLNASSPQIRGWSPGWYDYNNYIDRVRQVIKAFVVLTSDIKILNPYVANEGKSLLIFNDFVNSRTISNSFLTVISPEYQGIKQSIKQAIEIGDGIEPVYIEFDILSAFTIPEWIALARALPGITKAGLLSIRNAYLTAQLATRLKLGTISTNGVIKNLKWVERPIRSQDIKVAIDLKSVSFANELDEVLVGDLTLVKLPDNFWGVISAERGQITNTLDDIARLFDKNNSLTTLTIQGKILHNVPNPLNSKSVKIFSGATDDEIRHLAETLAGGPLNQVPNKPVWFKKIGNTEIRLRSIGNLANQAQTGARWTIDVVDNTLLTPIVKQSSIELKFQ